MQHARMMKHCCVFAAVCVCVCVSLLLLCVCSGLPQENMISGYVQLLKLAATRRSPVSEVIMQLFMLGKGEQSA